MQYQSRQKRQRSFNLEREGTLFFNFKGTLFSDFFFTRKTVRAKTFPSFSDKTYAIQDDMCGHGVTISCSLTISGFFST